MNLKTLDPLRRPVARKLSDFFYSNFSQHLLMTDTGQFPCSHQWPFPGLKPGSWLVWKLRKSFHLYDPWLHLQISNFLFFSSKILPKNPKLDPFAKLQLCFAQFSFQHCRESLSSAGSLQVEELLSLPSKWGNFSDQWKLGAHVCNWGQVWSKPTHMAHILWRKHQLYVKAQKGSPILSENTEGADEP